MNINLKSRILSNTFADQLRASMVYDASAFDELCGDLKSLSSSLKGSGVIDRELMLTLYSLPVVVRNTFLSFDDSDSRPAIAAKLEDAWIELDKLVSECLVD